MNMRSFLVQVQMSRYHVLLTNPIFCEKLQNYSYICTLKQKYNGKF